MAKNLYNLTAVTTVNDSDLLHVNQGSVSSDKKVTKQNLLKEVNSSITSLNNSLTKSYDADVLSDITIGANGYTQVTKPSAVIGKSIVSVSIITWTSNTGAFWFATQADGNNYFYVVGTPSAVIRGLKLRWWYKD